MKRPGLIWTAFALCVALAAFAMVRVGSMALELERAEARVRRQAAADETLQLALWRMDSALSPLIAEEGMRPYFTYSAFYPAERTYTKMFEVVEKGDVLVASPLLTYASPLVRLHFQYDPEGKLSSPQVPDGNMRDLAESSFIPPLQMEIASRRLRELSGLLTLPAVEVACSTSDTAPTALTSRFPQPIAQGRDTQEYVMRSRNTKKAQVATPERSLPAAGSEPVFQGPMQAAWIGDLLILGREVRVGRKTFFQGCWLDWDAIRSELLASVVDLMPSARLEPVRVNDQAPTRRLAALPAKIVDAPISPAVTDPQSPVKLSLWIAWACLIVAALAVAILLGGAISLSERRGTFVSAVTHELRTPLTTFQLYSEMLSEGMVSDPETRNSYFRTLRAESDRLSHLVENVLAFARIERGRSIARRDVTTSRALIERVKPALQSGADRGGMTLEICDQSGEFSLKTDVSVVEQILSNLVDNASKYAGSSKIRRIVIESKVGGSSLEISVRDFGPGMSRRALRGLFRPFSKSAQDAARSAPGVGLGLALSRRLARAIHGELTMSESGPEGVCFIVSLPLDG